MGVNFFEKKILIFTSYSFTYWEFQCSIAIQPDLNTQKYILAICSSVFSSIGLRPSGDPNFVVV